MQQAQGPSTNRHHKTHYEGIQKQKQKQKKKIRTNVHSVQLLVVQQRRRVRVPSRDAVPPRKGLGQGAVAALCVVCVVVVVGKNKTRRL
jgi:hypothetical protein